MPLWSSFNTHPASLLQAKLAASGPKGQNAEPEGPAAICEATADSELNVHTDHTDPSAAPAVSSMKGDFSQHGTFSADRQRDHADNSHSESGGHQITPTLPERLTNEDSPGTAGSSGTQSEDSPASCQEQSSCYHGAQESPIRGLIIPEHPADSRAIAEHVERVLWHDVSMCNAPDCSAEITLHSGGRGSLSDKASLLQSQPLDNFDDSASSSGQPQGADSAVGQSDTECAAEQEPDAPGDAALLPACSSSNVPSHHDECHVEQARLRSGAAPEGMYSSLPDDTLEACASASGNNPSEDRSEGRASCSAVSAPIGSDGPSEKLLSITEPDAALLSGAAVKWGSVGKLLPMLRYAVVRRVLLCGGVLVVAFMGAMQRRGGIMHFLRSLLRASAISQETMLRLR